MFHLRSSKHSPRSSSMVANRGAEEGFIGETICNGTVSIRDFTRTTLIDLAIYISFKVIMLVPTCTISFSLIIKAEREKFETYFPTLKYVNVENRFEDK